MGDAGWVLQTTHPPSLIPHPRCSSPRTELPPSSRLLLRWSRGILPELLLPAHPRSVSSAPTRATAPASSPPPPAPPAPPRAPSHGPSPWPAPFLPRRTSPRAPTDPPPSPRPPRTRRAGYRPLCRLYDRGEGRLHCLTVRLSDRKAV